MNSVLSLWLPLAPFGSLGVPLGCPWGALGRPLPRNVSNSQNRHRKTAFWNLPAVPAVPADPAEVVSASAAQTSPLHAPGVRMTGVKQTPSNDHTGNVDLYKFDITLRTNQ